MLFNQATLYVLITGTVKVASALANFLILSWVIPELIGIWQLLGVVQSYTSILGLGVINAMNRELPFYYGRGDSNYAEGLAATAYAYTIIASSVGLFGYFLFFLCMLGSSENWAVATAAAGLVWCLGNYRSYLEGTFRTGAHFGTLSKCHLIESVLGIITLPIVAWYGFLGLLLRSFLLAAIGVVILHILRPVRVLPKLKYQHLKKLVLVGLPLFLNAYLLSLTNGVDRLLLAGFGITQVGLFAPVEAVAVMMATIPQALTTYFYPKMVFDYGKSGGKASILKQARWLSMIAACTTAVVALVFWCIVSLTIDRFLPQYSSSKSSMSVALLAGILWGTHSVKIAFYVFKSWRKLACYTVCYALLKIVFGWFFVNYFTDPVYGIAMASLVSATLLVSIVFLLTISEV